MWSMLPSTQDPQIKKMLVIVTSSVYLNINSHSIYHIRLGVPISH